MIGNWGTVCLEVEFKKSRFNSDQFPCGDPHQRDFGIFSDWNRRMMNRKHIALEIERTFQSFPVKFRNVSEKEVTTIQNKVKEGSFLFYNILTIRLVTYEESDPIRERFYVSATIPEKPGYCFSLSVEPEEELVLNALFTLLYSVEKVTMYTPLPCRGREEDPFSRKLCIQAFIQD